MGKMTIDEAIYCMRSYLPDEEERCYACPCYASRHEDGSVYVCASSEAHMKAIDALTELKRQGGTIWRDNSNMTDVCVSEPTKYDGDTENYVWGMCQCCLVGEGIKMPKMRNKAEYRFKCKRCGTEGLVSICLENS